jgi:hypothetical protein
MLHASRDGRVAEIARVVRTGTARTELLTAETAENAELLEFPVCGLGALGGEELLDTDRRNYSACLV